MQNSFQLLGHLNAMPANLSIQIVGKKRIKLHAQ
jgi:hypothetical protein